ncbi:MAG: hypothetical protein JST87_15870 [Bacteroidetes bacterium]|nr:hypothetical protein [Bacteroidota bacterium]
MKKIVLHLLLIALFSACKNHSPASASNPADSSVKKNYFPVASFIRDEIRYVDSMPLGILKQTIKNGQKDSGYIKNDEFHELAQEFIPSIFSSGDFEKDYTETSFMDQTTESVTFTYATKNKEQEVKRIDVLAKPGDSFIKVKSVYMEKAAGKNDTLITKKMFWKAKHNFQVVTIIQPSGQKPVIEQLKVVWDDSE